MKIKQNLICFIMIIAFLALPAAAAQDGDLVPMGNTVGIQIHAAGVMVVGLTPVKSGSGDSTPALDAGLRTGDMLTHIGGVPITDSALFFKEVQKTGGETLQLKGLRNGKPISFALQPVKTEVDDQFRIGVWVRDHMAGIGTMTFYDPEDQLFGALGHGIHEGETDRLMPISEGSVTDADIVDVKKGVSGDPGELRGSFDLNSMTGTLFANTDSGIFGHMKPSLAKCEHKALPMAQPDEVKTGKAMIYSQVTGKQVRGYEVEILKLMNAREKRNLVLKVTDKDLLAATGGIVQGMSGSPIVQDGKLVGAVTHVFVNDPQKGYGIYITNMLNTAKDAETDLHAMTDRAA